MPKLSQSTLEKRFHCPHCDKSLRTRQGLSGHIRFMHNGGLNQISITDTNEFAGMMNRELKVMVAANVPDTHIRIMSDIFSGWKRYLTICGGLNLSPTMQDFKNLVAVSCLKHSGS